MVKAGNLVVDESMSNNLTSTSGEVISASSSVLLNPLQQSFASTDQGAAAPTKKKRNLPGNPDPDAEVIALSPKSLLATNRFVCEICNKGFQRDQNLQLHRRGHNLPWKLKQRTSKDVGEVVMRKKVYVCPETTCVHHHPSRALGDLTGIKKHFSRKHGEKKWKCEKCSKRYAVQSDWKAHSKICGTREYKCDCGTLFSRRDSFITHRAFCDALAEESTRAISNMGRNLQPKLHALTVKREEEEDPVISLSSRVSAAAADQSVPRWLGVGADGSAPHYSINLSSSSPISLLDHNPNENPSSNAVVLLPPYQAHIANSPHMSATALLQKAAQMGVAMQITPPYQYQYHHAAAAPAHMSSSGSTTSFAASTADHGSGLGHLSARELSSFGNKAALLSSGFTENAVSTATNSTSTTAGVAPPNSRLHVHDMMMSSLSSSSSGFDEIIYMEHKIRKHPF